MEQHAPQGTLAGVMNQHKDSQHSYFWTGFVALRTKTELDSLANASFTSYHRSSFCLFLHYPITYSLPILNFFFIALTIWYYVFDYFKSGFIDGIVYHKRHTL